METRFTNLLRAPKCGEQIGRVDPVRERVSEAQTQPTRSLQWSEFGFGI